MEKATGGTWDPVSRVYKDKNAIYAEEVAHNMVTDVPGYTPLLPQPNISEGSAERILNPKHQKEFDRCMNDENETVMVAPKQSIPICKLSPGMTTGTPNPITLAKPLPTKIQRDDTPITSGLTDNKFGRQAVDDESLFTLGSVNTNSTIHTGQDSTPSKVEYLCSK